MPHSNFSHSEVNRRAIDSVVTRPGYSEEGDGHDVAPSHKLNARSITGTTGSLDMDKIVRDAVVRSKARNEANGTRRQRAVDRAVQGTTGALEDDLTGLEELALQQMALASSGLLDIGTSIVDSSATPGRSSGDIFEGL